MNDPVHYMLRGREVVTTTDFMELARWYEKSGLQRRVKLTHLPDGRTLSTVFLGIDHNFTGKGGPILFETMLFGDPGPGNTDRLGEDLACERCRTYAEAEAQHDRMLLEAQQAPVANMPESDR